MKKIKWEKPIVKKISDEKKEEFIVEGDCVNGSTDAFCRTGLNPYERCVSGSDFGS